ncbi:MAG TPA: chromate efflux transporter [Candidatus Eremiobacteraceae bacterium]|nr:chromate efflux transporter [Candidatus Eremiobacteraceae bacterium]
MNEGAAKTNEGADASRPTLHAPGRTGSPSEAPSVLEIGLYFLRLGAVGFGGPVALANHMRTDLAEKRHWLTPQEYDEGLAIATACPGPLAYQLGIYCGYILRGFSGALTAAIAFAIAPFAIVVTAGYLYVRFATAWEVRALFYGIGPVIVALIVKACWNLAQKTVRDDKIAWLIAAAACAITLMVQKELTAIFLAAGVLGVFIFSASSRTPSHDGNHPQPEDTVTARGVTPFVGMLALWTSPAMTSKLFFFFFRTGLLVFGSGLVIVPFLKTYVVDQYHWLSQQQFLDSVAIGMMTPGPVVITATFVGYLLSGFGGAIAATIGIFLPSFLFTVVGTPLLRRYRTNARLQGFVRGVTVAVVGVLVGTSYLVGKSVLADALTITVGLTALAATVYFKRVPDPLLVAAGAVVGLVAYPLIHPQPL